MRIFVTGATGFIGSAIVRELLTAGHRVLGLSRSDEGARALTALGAEVHRGSLDDLDGLARGAAASDGVIHTAFVHDFARFEESCRTDERAIQALGAALAGSDRPLVTSSGLLGFPPGRSATEDDRPSDATPRASERAALAFASRGVRAMTVRLSPTVHGDGDHGFVPALIRTARAGGAAIYVGDGRNRWPAVHRLDAARLYRLALEKGAAGARFHGVAEEGVAIRDVAEAIGRRLGVPAASRTPAEATAALGFIGHVLAQDVPASNGLTRERLGWRPTERGLLDDLEKGTYFDA